ncbi:MAG: twin-arginine translocase TatA/TatE family subunit [Ignavibacteriae bacterium]|nr:twin-arginine translocase TatA/TatE family subunit [Ignavibacteriota bacterium]
MPNLGPMEIILIVLVVLIFFGAKKIPELAQGLGKGLREFRKATREAEEDHSGGEKKIEDKGTKKDV